MPKNFDEMLNEDLTFIIAGESFTMHLVRPEVLAAWEDEEDPETSMESLAEADKKIKLFLAPEDHGRWDSLRARDENPVSSAALNALIRWMIEVQTGRPTQTPSPSDSGPGSTEATSTAVRPVGRGSRRQTVAVPGPAR